MHMWLKNSPHLWIKICTCVKLLIFKKNKKKLRLESREQQSAHSPRAIQIPNRIQVPDDRLHIRYRLTKALRAGTQGTRGTCKGRALLENYSVHAGTSNITYKQRWQTHGRPRTSGQSRLCVNTLWTSMLTPWSMSWHYHCTLSPLRLLASKMGF